MSKYLISWSASRWPSNTSCFLALTAMKESGHSIMIQDVAPITLRVLSEWVCLVFGVSDSNATRNKRD